MSNKKKIYNDVLGYLHFLNIREVIILLTPEEYQIALFHSAGSKDRLLSALEQNCFDDNYRDFYNAIIEMENFQMKDNAPLFKLRYKLELRRRKFVISRNLYDYIQGCYLSSSVLNSFINKFDQVFDGLIEKIAS